MKAYRFPIYLLGEPSQPLQRLNAITSWCVVTAGREDYDSDEEAALQLYGEMAEAGKLPRGAPNEPGDADRDTFAVVLGQRKFGEHSGTVSWYLDFHNRARQWIQTMSGRYGSPSFVSVGHALLWEQVGQLKGDSSTSLGWRQFTTLCAVNCAIGDKQHPFPVSREFIRAASIGFKSGKGFFLADGKPSEAGLKAIKSLRMTDQFPTVQQTRDDLDQLEAQGLLGRIIVSRRATAYFRPDVCTREQALEMIKKSRNQSLELKRRRDQERKFLRGSAKNHSEPLNNQ